MEENPKLVVHAIRQGSLAKASAETEGEHVLGFDCNSGRRHLGETALTRSSCPQVAGISLDRRYALSASSDKTIWLADLASGRERRSFEGHTENVDSVCFSPDGRYALSGR